MRAPRFHLPRLAAGLALLAFAGPAAASLDTAGFRAVGVAHSAFPISAMAAAPDGRLFVAVQAKGPTSGTTPGTAEIRVYSAYAASDGAILDEGVTWATVDGVRATTTDEGLLGIALAPDFAASKLLYVYLTTTDESVNQHVRVYRETAAGLGEYLGAVQSTLEPPQERPERSGGGLAFGVDNCLHVGIGDNGSASRWNSQLLLGTDNISTNESNALCTNVCLGTAEFPSRTVTNNGQPNAAGKVLRLAVSGPSAVPAPGSTVATWPAVFSGGLRNPTALGVHPLSGQVYVSERAETQQAEIDVLDRGSNGGWPCLEGTVVSGGAIAGCLAGKTASDVYAKHPLWRRPVATSAGTAVITGVAAYTGLAYPAEYYGDVFYLLRDSARIYRLDLAPPCFLPHPGGVTPVKLHDSNSDGDFQVFGSFGFTPDPTDVETLNAPNLMAIAQAPDPRGQLVLYVAGKQGTGSLTDDSVIFRIEFASAFVPYGGPAGRVPDSCFGGGVYSGGSGPAPYAWENPFERATCALTGGACAGQPDGTPCRDGDVCNGEEACQGGFCRPGTPVADGTACQPTNPCLQTGTCQAAYCSPGPPVADGAACPDGNPCNGLETCAAGVCQPSAGPQGLTVRNLALKREGRPGTGGLMLTASFAPAIPIAPQSTDDVSLEVAGAAPAVSHPDSDRRWRRSRPPRLFLYQGAGRGISSVKIRSGKGGVFDVALRAKGLHFESPDGPTQSPRLVIGQQCFVADLGCAAKARNVRCR